MKQQRAIASGRILRAILGAVLLLGAATASAHKESDAYVTLRTADDNPHALNGQWDIALRDLNFALGIDSNRDGAITWGEVKAHRQAIERYALAHLRVTGDGLTCDLQPHEQKIDTHSDGTYAVILFRALCDKDVPSRITIDYSLFADIDPYHRGIVTLRAGNQTAGAVLGPSNTSASLNARTPNRWRQFKSFVYDGMWHIWEGIDHMLFILSLLLASVLIRRAPHSEDGSGPVDGLHGTALQPPGNIYKGVPDKAQDLTRDPPGSSRATPDDAPGYYSRQPQPDGPEAIFPRYGVVARSYSSATPPSLRLILGKIWPSAGRRAKRQQALAHRSNRDTQWVPVDRLWPAFIEIVKIVSAFTVSHSVTLTLAVLGIVVLPSRLVESGIALSIVVAALNNIYPLVRRRVWLVAFGFGFIHGLGFAGALAGLNLPAGAMAASLGGFNVGVEIGQETVVLALMPIAFLLRHTRFYRVFVLRWGSAAIAIIATGWLIQRAFDITIPWFGAILPG